MEPPSMLSCTVTSRAIVLSIDPRGWLREGAMYSPAFATYRPSVRLWSLCLLHIVD